MRLNNYQLRKWLAREVLGKEIRRKPPKRETGRGPTRNEKYLAWIRTLPSAVSGQSGCEAAHTGSDGGMAEKASDLSSIPLTRQEHREYHQIGKLDFEKRYGVDCARVVKRLNRAWRSRQRSAA